MSPSFRWSCLTLAALLALAWIWTTRYDYQACDVDGCVAVNRWTGAVHFQSVDQEPHPGGPDPVMVRRP